MARPRVTTQPAIDVQRASQAMADLLVAERVQLQLTLITPCGQPIELATILGPGWRLDARLVPGS